MLFALISFFPKPPGHSGPDFALSSPCFAYTIRRTDCKGILRQIFKGIRGNDTVRRLLSIFPGS